MGILTGLVICAISLCMGGCPVDPEDTDLNPATRLFLTKMKYAATGQPFAVAADDVNKDGRNDLITANQGGNTVSVLLAKDTGGFSKEVNYAVGRAPTTIVIVDVNGDTNPDALTANSGTSDISVLMGVGDGTFSAETRVGLTVDAAPLSMTVADVDGNGTLDLVSADSGLGSASVLLGAGDGTFAVPVSYPVGQQPRSVIAADLNGDTQPDLVAANRNTNNVSVLFNQGAGVFAAAVDLAAGASPRMVGAADLNNDSWNDLVVSNPGSGDLSVIMNLGGGTFAAAVSVAFTNTLPTRFALADFNNDNKIDVAALLFSADAEPVPVGAMAVRYGDGTGAFGAERVFGTGLQSFDLIPAAINSDSYVDLVSADPNADEVSIMYGRPGGAFDSDEHFADGDNPRVLLTADVNRDNNPDILVINQDSRDLAVLLGKGDGTFQPEISTPVSDLPRAMRVGNVNTDNFLDVVVTNLHKSRVSIFLGRGDGTFQAERFASVLPAGVSGSAEPRSIAMADINGDTMPDLVTGNANMDFISVLIGKGTGNFETAHVAADKNNFPLDVHLADLNGDGRLDLVFVSTNNPEDNTDTASPRVVRYLGNGDGTFDDESRERYETGPQPRAMTIRDVDNDGMLDAVTVHPGDDSVYVLYGRPGGKFLRGERIRVGESPNSVTVADVTNDDVLDIITTNDSDFLSVLSNRGGRRYNAVQMHFCGSYPINGIVADVNKDGRADMIVGNRAINDVSVLLGAP